MSLEKFLEWGHQLVVYVYCPSNYKLFNENHAH